MKQSKIARLLAGTMLLSTLLTGCGAPAAPGTPSSGSASKGESGSKTVTMAITAAWDNFNPFNTSSNYTDAVNEQIYDHLFVSTKTGEAEPRLAKEWKMSDDHQTFTVKLQENAVWHDGEPVTAEDVAWTCELAADPTFSSLRRNAMRYLSGTDDSGVLIDGQKIGVTAVDTHTVDFNLKAPTDEATMTSMFNRYFFVLPKHVYGEMSMDEINKAENWQNPIGSGPFKYGSEISGERVELNANPDYYLGAPKFDRLIIRVVQNANLLAGLMSGEIDVIAGAGLAAIPLSDWENAQKQENLVCEALSSYQYQYMAMNCQRLPQDVRVAIDKAINKQVIIDSLMQGEGTELIVPLTPDHPYYDTTLPDSTYDPEGAKQLLKKANWDESKVLTLMVPTGNQVRERSAPLIQQDLAKVGVQVQIETVDFPTLMASLREGKTDLGLMGSAGSVDPDESSPNVTLNHPSNFSCITDPTLMDLATEGVHGISFEERKPIYDQYQQKLVEQMPMSYLYSAKVLLAHNKRLSNLRTENFEMLNWCTWEWEVA